MNTQSLHGDLQQQQQHSNRHQQQQQQQQLLQRGDYKEMSIFSKLKKIKQFKENLKRYTLKQIGDNSSEINSSFDQDDSINNKSMQSSPDHMLNYLQVHKSTFHAFVSFFFSKK
jgi:tRNA-dihydrouridine synthase